jgi:hypothetical protein
VYQVTIDQKYELNHGIKSGGIRDILFDVILDDSTIYYTPRVMMFRSLERSTYRQHIEYNLVSETNIIFSGYHYEWS